MASGDDVVPREELEALRVENAALQRNFDDFQDGSRELEEELEAELERAQEQLSELTKRMAEQTERLGDQQTKSRALGGEVATAQAEARRLRAAATREAAEKATLEQSADELEAKCRAAMAAEEDFRHKLDLAIEEKIFVSNDLEDLRAEALRTEQGLRSEIEDLRQELGRLGVSRASSPGLVLPSSISAAGARNTQPDSETVAEAVIALTEDMEAEGDDGARIGDLVLGDGFNTGDPMQTGDNDVARDPEAADDLIKALEEEVELLTAQLQEAEAANDDLNLELQELQEQLLDRGDAIGGIAAGGVVESEGSRPAKGDNNHRSISIESYETENVALKKELSEAMGTCEELDQTVTDLTEELYAKDEQRSVLEARQAELERELGSRTQSLEDEVSKAKTSASSLATRLADTEAELRASNGRLEETSSKVASAQEREEMFREELASLRERIAELTLARAALSDEATMREAQLEEALASAERLRAETGNLRDRVKTLTAELAQVAEARRVAERTAEERLQAELAAERERSDTAVALATAEATAAIAAHAPAESDVPLARDDPRKNDDNDKDGRRDWSDDSRRNSCGKTLDSNFGNGSRSYSRGGQGEGQSSGEPVQRRAGMGAEGVTSCGVGSSATGQASASERELGEEVMRLKQALLEAQKKAVKTRHGTAKDGAVVMYGFNSSLADALDSSDIDVVKSELRLLGDLYRKERDRNATLLSKMRALKGNIEVICRIRPPTSEETTAGVPIALEALGDGEVGVRISSRDGARPGGQGIGTGATTSGSPSWRSFSLDRALGPSTSQEEVFREVEPLALSAADGMNACIFAYGQTGSGKTHTMIGDAKGGDMAGISYRTMNKLFEVLDHRQQQQPEYSFSVRVAMLEIYNEEVRDLLTSDLSSNGLGSNGGGNGGDSAAAGTASDAFGGGELMGSGSWHGGKLEIRRGQDGMIQVPGLSQVVVTSAQEVLSLLERGGNARAVAATGVHDHSSRSHSVLLAEVTSRAGPDVLPSTGRLFLVDLAGSERIKVSGVTGAGLREATNINSSLSALGDVMQALDQKHKHVPYRNSKLTFLLQDALGGNSRTAMVVTVCPTVLNVDETLFALQFAARARNISLGPAQRNVGAKNLLEELKELRARLREAGRKKEYAEEALATLQREHARSQQKMNALLDARAKNVGDLRYQLEAQIESLKGQLADSQASVLTERNKRASLQADAEDWQRQLKRSQAKVTSLVRDREDREAKLQAKQEEVGELKAELRKVVSEAKNTVRRLSAGRTGAAASGGAFGFTPRGGGGGHVENMLPGKGPPHTPSKKLSEAKSRYRMMREGSGKITSQSSASGGSNGAPSPAGSTSMPNAPRTRVPSHFASSPDPCPCPIPGTHVKGGIISGAPTESVTTTSAPSDGASSSEGRAAAVGVDAVNLSGRAEGSFAGGQMTGESISGGLSGMTSSGNSARIAEGWRADDVDTISATSDVGDPSSCVASAVASHSRLYVSSEASEEEEHAHERQEGRGQAGLHGGAAAEAAAAIAAATAIFAKVAGSSAKAHDNTGNALGENGRKSGAGAGAGAGERHRSLSVVSGPGDVARTERKSSSHRPRAGSGTTHFGGGSVGHGRASISGLTANFSKPTASSISRLRVSAPPVPAFDGSTGGATGAGGGSAEAPVAKTSRRSAAKHFGGGDENLGPTSARHRPPSPTGRVTRATRLHSSSSSTSSGGSQAGSSARSGSHGKVRPASPPPDHTRTRASFSGVSSSSATGAGSGSIGTMSSSATFGGGHGGKSGRPASPAAARTSSRTVSLGGHSSGGGGRGWLAERFPSVGSASDGAGEIGEPGGAVAPATAGGGGGAGASGATRAQIALMKHQERMDRIREIRGARKAARGRDAPS